MPEKTGAAVRSAGGFGRTSLALFCLSLSMAFGMSGCHNTPPSPAPNPSANTASTTAGGTSPTNSAPVTPAVAYDPFDGDRAFETLQKQCAFGVRPLGTTAHAQTQAYLIAEMQKVADSTVLQSFKYHGLPVTNIVGVFNPAGSNKPAARPILLMAHWDTRPVADGPYSAKRNLHYKYGPNGWTPTSPIMGANDAASGAAILLEIGRILHKQKPAVGVLLLLDDGEDYGDFNASGGKGDGIELGSRYFADHFTETLAFGRPFYGILLDMVGGKDPVFPREQYSEEKAKSINDNVFAIAEKLGYGKVFRSDKLQSINDDHIAINEAGIRMIDIIPPLPRGGNDPNDATAYRYWHTQQDTANNCSSKTLKIVGDVVLKVLYSETP